MIFIAPRPRCDRPTGVTRPHRAREPMTDCVIVIPNSFSSTNLSPRAPRFQQKHSKTSSVFSSLKVVFLSKKVVFIPLIVIAPQLWCTFPTIVGKYKIQRKTKCSGAEKQIEYSAQNKIELIHRFVCWVNPSPVLGLFPQPVIFKYLQIRKKTTRVTGMYSF